MLQYAAPFFEEDVLLQRTFMTLISWGQLETILSTCLIDAVVLMANMHFFLHNRKILDGDFKVRHLKNIKYVCSESVVSVRLIPVIKIYKS